MTEIKIFCDNQELKVLEKPVIASGGFNENKIIFSFSSHWEGFDKEAVFYKTKEEKFRVKIEDNECIIPITVLDEEGSIYISVYGKNGDDVRTSNVVRYGVEEGAASDGTEPYEPIRKEAYEEGYKDGYEDGSELEKQLIDFTEQTGSIAIFNFGSVDYPVKLPYINSKTNWGYYTEFSGIFTELGLNVSGISNDNAKVFTSIKKSKDICNKLILTKMSKAPNGYWRMALSGMQTLKEFYTDEIMPLSNNNTWALSFMDVFRQCLNLKVIGGFNPETKEIDSNYGKISFTNCKDTNNMFYKCASLREVRFVPNTLSISLNMQDSSLLTKETCLSLVNVCNADTPNTLFLNENVKNSMKSGTWYCIFNEDTGLWEDYDVETKPVIEGVCSYEYALTSDSSVITGAKGWSLK